MKDFSVYSISSMRSFFSKMLNSIVGKKLFREGTFCFYKFLSSFRPIFLSLHLDFLGLAGCSLREEFKSRIF